MSFVNRRLYKQKPQAWGPVSAVQASIFKNAERIGIDPKFRHFMPCWSLHDYIQNIEASISGKPNINKNSIIFDGGFSNDTIYFANNTNISPVNLTFFISLIAYGETDVQKYYAGKLRDINGGSYIYKTTSAGGIEFNCRTYDGTYRTPYVRTTYTVGMPTHLVGTYDGISVKLYQDGRYIGESPGGGNVQYNTLALTYGAQLSDGTYEIKMDLLLSGLLPYSIADNAALFLSNNPYFLLQRVPPVFYSVPGGGITITTSLDGKVIIRTATAALLDCMASIKNNASNILDGAAVVSTTKTDAIDGKTILKSVASSIFDSKASVLSIASLLLDGKAIVSDTGSLMFAGKGTVKDSTYDIVDGKSIVKSNNTAILDGKSIFLSTGTTVIDGKVIVNAEGFSSSLLDGKTSIKSVATNYLDGLIYIGNAADKNIDGKSIIKSSLGLTMDGKTTIKDVSSNLLDGSASILTSIANIVDGKIIISDAAIGLLDGEAVILDYSSIILDGKVFLSSGSEINIFDGKITLSVPIVGKVAVTFSMRSPSVSFAIRTPSATVSIN